jgi:hypothetical protein
MNRTYGRGLLACIALPLFSACSPEGFEVTPCLLNGQLAFRVHRIEGWFTDYQPRPTRVLVLEHYDGDDFQKAAAPYRWPGLWSAELNHDAFENRPSRQLIVYGQRLPGWEVSQSARPLVRGRSYSLSISDGGRDGYADFTAGVPLPACS